LSITNPDLKSKFVDYLNEILSAENAAIDRLQKRIQETPIQEAKQRLQQHLQETRGQQGRLEKLITDYDGSPTKSKADLPMLKPPATSMMKDTLKNTVKSMTKGTENPTAEETEIRNIKEDAIIENAEIIAYKICSQLAGKLNAQDAISVCQQNTEEEVSMFNWIMTSTPSMVNQLWPKIESSITTNSEL
jgi:ferritin-like metal-binding protein YciE